MERYVQAWLERRQGRRRLARYKAAGGMQNTAVSLKAAERSAAIAREVNSSFLQDTGAARTKREEVQGVCRAAKHPQGIAGISMPSKGRRRNAFCCNGSAHYLPTTNERDRFPLIKTFEFGVHLI
jgi:hypothetical protein